jgi:hypothetical protein
MAASRPVPYSEVCTTTTGAPHDAQTTKVARTPVQIRRDSDPAAAARDFYRTHLREHFEFLTAEVVRARRLSDRIEIGALALSVVTSGAVWTLLAAHVGAFAEWTGAAAGTLTTFLLIFQKTFGPQKRLDKLMNLLKACARMSSEVRMLDFDSETGQRLYGDWKEFQTRWAEAGLPPLAASPPDAASPPGKSSAPLTGPPAIRAYPPLPVPRTPPFRRE